MKRTRRTYSRDYKLAAVKKVIEQGLSYAEVARDLGIGDTLIHNWRKAFEADGTLQAEVTQSPSVEAELKRLREENRQLKMERDMLNKTTTELSFRIPGRRQWSERQVAFQNRISSALTVKVLRGIAVRTASFVMIALASVEGIKTISVIDGFPVSILFILVVPDADRSSAQAIRSRGFLTFAVA